MAAGAQGAEQGEGEGLAFRPRSRLIGRLPFFLLPIILLLNGDFLAQEAPPSDPSWRENLAFAHHFPCGGAPRLPPCKGSSRGRGEDLAFRSQSRLICWVPFFLFLFFLAK